MHDVNRDSMLQAGKPHKRGNGGHAHDHEEHHRGDGHEHDREDAHAAHSPEHPVHQHDHEPPRGHEHEHDAAAYEEHEGDLHVHNHAHGTTEDRAFRHLHEHGHDFYHSHHHEHHPEHTTIVHKFFGNPRRDWFAVGLMGMLIIAGYVKLLPGYLSDGMLVCAAMIGVFPLCRNALFECIAQRKFKADILVGGLLLTGLFMGRFMEVATLACFLLIGSFLRLNFSWRHE